MTRIPIPADLAQSIADRCVRDVRSDITRRGWKSASALQPLSSTGKVGITSTVNYLLIQNKGFSPFVMWWVKNRTLPLGCKQGDGPHFRNGKGVGTPGYVDIPHKGKVYRPVRWKHPGIKPQRFMESSLTKGIKESRGEIQSTIMRALKGEL